MFRSFTECHEPSLVFCSSNLNLSLVTRKPVLGECGQVRLKPAYSATDTSQSLESLDIEARGIILSRQRTTKALVRLRGWAGRSAPLLFAYGINRFSHDVAHLMHFFFFSFDGPMIESVPFMYFCSSVHRAMVLRR